MHCPKCATESDLDQKFCRKCGFNLTAIGKLVQAHDGEADEVKIARVEGDKQILQRMVSWMMRGGLIMLIGVVIIVVNKQLRIDQLVGLMGTLVALGGVSIATYGLLDAMRCGGLKNRKSKEISTPREHEIERASTTKSLEGRLPVPLGSVTERTTELLGVDREQPS